jgi:hypothetical protein
MAAQASASDSSATMDSGLTADTAAPVDSGAATDSGVPGLGVAADSSVATDSSVGRDSVVTIDSSLVADSTGSAEAGAVVDTTAAVAAGSEADTVGYVLSPVTVTVERDFAVAPPVSTVRVDPEELRRTQAANPYDLVRRVTGVEVHDHGQGPGFAPNVVIRGFTSDHSSDVLLSVDGVPINLPINGHQEGYADWYVLMPGAVSSMRVLPGTATPLYGNFALAGVVEVFTAADADGTAGAVSGTSEQDLAGWVRTGFRKERGGGLGALDLHRQNGWRDNSDDWTVNALLRGWRRVGSGRLEGGLQLYGAGWDSPGFLTVAEFNDGDLTQATDPSDGGSGQRAILHGRWSSPLGSAASLEVTGWAQAVRSHAFLHVPEDGTDTQQTDEEDDRLGAGGEAQISLQPTAGQLTVGISGRVEQADYDLFDTEERERIEAEKSFDANYAAGGAYARWRHTVFGRLGLDIGARLDALHYASQDQLIDEAPTESATHVVGSPKVGLRFRASNRAALFASLSRGFRGAPGAIEDPDLPPLVAWSTEVGVEGGAGPLDLRAALFRMDVDNERIQDPITREIANVGGSIRQGVDVSGGLQLTSGLRLSGSATLNDARISDDDGSLASPSAARTAAALAGKGMGGATGARLAHVEPLEPGERVPGVASYAGHVQLEALVATRYPARATWRFLGPYVPLGEPDIRTEPYGVLDLGATFPWGSSMELDLELQNVLDAKYPEIRSSGFISPGAPRTFVAALRLNP